MEAGSSAAGPSYFQGTTEGHPETGIHQTGHPYRSGFSYGKYVGRLASFLRVGHERKVVVQLEIPGMDKENVNIDVHDTTLQVSGEKRFERDVSGSRYRSFLCAYGSFRRNWQRTSALIYTRFVNKWQRTECVSDRKTVSG